MLLPRLKSRVSAPNIDELQKACESFNDISTMDHADAWYDYLLTVRTYHHGTATESRNFEALFSKVVSVYGKEAAALPSMTDEQKAAKNRIITEYSSQMVEKGGISTNVFKKALGEDVTREFYYNVFFAPSKYRF